MPFRSTPGILATMVLVLGLVLTAPGQAALPQESSWKQHWWDEAMGSWVPLGVILLDATADRVTAQPIAATYTRRGAHLPDAAMVGSTKAGEVRFRGRFGKRRGAENRPTDEDHLIEFRLRIVDDRTLEGGVFDGDAEAGRTRLVQLTHSELLGELEAAVRDWQVERKIVEATLPPLREQLAFLEKQLADDRALGRVGLNGQSTLVLDQTRMQIMSNDLRRTATVEGEQLAGELATRLRGRFPDAIAEDRRAPAIADGESFWLQHWKNPVSGEWLTLGLLRMVEQADVVSVQPINFTYTARDAQLPEGPLGGRKTDATLTLRGAFGRGVNPNSRQPPDRTLHLDFELKRVANGDFSGVIRDGDEVLSETRFVLIADRGQLLRELEKIELQWGVERAVVMGTIPSLRDQVSALEKQDQSERASGRGGLTPMARINLDHARRSILVEELRLMTTTSGIAGVREWSIRLREAP